MSQKEAEIAERLRQTWNGPMTSEEIDFLRDVQGFIDFAVRNGLSFSLVMAGLTHDLEEIARDGFDLKKSTKRHFQPRVTGYSKVVEESFGDETPAD